MRSCSTLKLACSAAQTDGARRRLRRALASLGQEQSRRVLQAPAQQALAPRLPSSQAGQRQAAPERCSVSWFSSTSQLLA